MRRKRVSGISNLVAICFCALAMIGCSGRIPEPPKQFGSAANQLKPVENPLEGPTVQRTVYVPVYSSIYEGVKREMVELSATVSIRNVSSRRPLILNFVRYYDSQGRKIRDYLDRPAQLGPLATVEFVVQRMDTAGGPGASFLVEWSGAADIDEPIMEAVMFGQSGAYVGISFTSRGQSVQDVREQKK